MRRDIFSSPLLRSQIRSADTQRSERILGYFLGPCLVYMMYTGAAGTYLTQFYTDVLGLSGVLMTMMPLVGKILSSITGFLIGRLIDRTRTTQGKARPWLFLSGPLLALCGTALYAVPRASWQTQLVWVVVSYNLFFSLAFSVYALSHSLMVPLSTRDTRQRDSLAMLTSTGTAMIPGILVTILMPLLVNRIGVGTAAQGAWLRIMSILSILAIPATLIEYYFTRERVTEDAAQSPQSAPPVSFARQLRACLRDKYWVMVLLFTVMMHLCSSLSTGSMLYYCNWVLGSSIESGATKQILVNMIGQAPMGLGVVILWPLVRKFGKRRVTIVGFSLAAAGSLAVLLAGNRMAAVLCALFVKSVGALPTYVTAALLAEALDHVEQKNGFRVDGFSASVNSVAQTVVLGLSQSVLLFGIHAFGYITPTSTTQIITQPEPMRVFFSWCFAGIPMLCFAVCAGIMVFYRPEAAHSAPLDTEK